MVERQPGRDLCLSRFLKRLFIEMRFNIVEQFFLHFVHGSYSLSQRNVMHWPKYEEFVVNI